MAMPSRELTPGMIRDMKVTMKEKRGKRGEREDKKRKKREYRRKDKYWCWW